VLFGPNDSSGGDGWLPILRQGQTIGTRQRGAGNVIIATYLSLKHRGDRSEAGASLVEYALLVALIAVVCIVAIGFFGSELGDSFSRSGSQLP
jgi:pilus assembly protein Flp/PilA